MLPKLTNFLEIEDIVALVEAADPKPKRGLRFRTRKRGLMPIGNLTELLPSGWYQYILTDGVVETLPGIYEWSIEGAGSYIGKYTWISRPKSEYEKNVLKILNGWRYRPQKPDKFRRERRHIQLIILENVDPSSLNQREYELIIERGTLNGRTSD